MDLRHGETLQRARELRRSLGEAVGSRVAHDRQTCGSDCGIGTRAVLRGLRASYLDGVSTTNQVLVPVSCLESSCLVTLIQRFHNAKSVMVASRSGSPTHTQAVSDGHTRALLLAIYILPLTLQHGYKEATSY